MRKTRFIFSATLIVLFASCSAQSENDAQEGISAGNRNAETLANANSATSVGVRASEGQSSYSQDQTISVGPGTPAAVEAIVTCQGPEYTVVSESYMEEGYEVTSIVGDSQARQRISPQEVADAVGIDVDAVVNRFEELLTTTAGGAVGFTVAPTGTDTICSVRLTDESTGEILANEEVTSDYEKTVFPLLFPSGADESGRAGDSTSNLTYPSGDPVLPGYPVKVSGASIDRRVTAFADNPDQEYVALAPGVYAPYTPVEPDLTAYLDGPSSGDCTVRAKFFVGTGGSCWSGVGPGTEEPPL